MTDYRQRVRDGIRTSIDGPIEDDLVDAILALLEETRRETLNEVQDVAWDINNNGLVRYADIDEWIDAEIGRLAGKGTE